MSRSRTFEARSQGVKRLLAAVLTLVSIPIVVAAVIPAPIKNQTAPSSTAAAEIPPDLLPIYIGASYECGGLPWQVLAGIGWVESRHAGGRADPITGQVSPAIVGPAINGREGFAAIRDSSSPDGWAHALGPMQFLSTTFASWGVVASDRPPGALPDPQNAWDAIYSAAAYLCAGQAAIDDVDAAVRRYNHSDQYVDDVLRKATEYGLGRGAVVGSDLVPGSGEAVVAAALTQLGVPYKWGGSTPGVGFDCSGLVQWAYAQIGISLPRTTGQQVSVGVAVGVDELRPGDLIFSRSIRRGGEVIDRGHVAVYAGGGQVVVAPSAGDVVKVRPLNVASVQAARRLMS
jgi:cell wall-associated NlpC family hydrolase